MDDVNIVVEFPATRVRDRCETDKDLTVRVPDVLLQEYHDLERAFKIQLGLISEDDPDEGPLQPPGKRGKDHQ
jgi:hypothetical protein